MEDVMRKLVLAAKKSIPNDWIGQRNCILRVIEEMSKNDPNAFKQEELAGGKILVLIFRYEGAIYFWWDGVKDGRIVECSGLEKAISRPLNGKIRTEILWCSDPDSREPFIPQLPIEFT